MGLWENQSWYRTAEEAQDLPWSPSCGAWGEARAAFREEDLETSMGTSLDSGPLHSDVCI